MRNGVKKLLLCLTLVIVCGFSSVLMACEKLSIKNFDVGPAITVALGEQVTLPLVKATDSEGKEYIATSTVADSAGNAVAVTDSKFTATKLGSEAYTITYMVKIGDIETKKTVKVNVVDSAVPIITVGKSDFMLLRGKEFDLGNLAATVVDNSGETPRIEYTAKVGTSLQTIVAGKLTPSVVGDCIITLNATDSSGNKAVERTITLPVQEVNADNLIVNIANLTTGKVTNATVVDDLVFAKAIQITGTASGVTATITADNKNIEIYQTAKMIVHAQAAASISVGDTGAAYTNLVAGWNIITLDSLNINFGRLSEVASFTINVKGIAVVNVCSIEVVSKATVKSFSVIENIAKSAGDEYTVEDAFVLFTNDFSIDAVATVKYGAEDIVVTNKKFSLSKAGTYKVIYTVTSQYLDGGSMTKETTITVTDMTAPTIVLPYGDKVIQAGDYDYDAFKQAVVVTDDSGTASKSFEIKDAAGTAVDIVGGKFSAISGGAYTITVTSSDLSENKVSKSITLYVIDSAYLAGAKHFYDTAAFAATDFDFSGNTISSSTDASGTVGSISAKSLKLSIPAGGADLKFKKLAVSVIEDTEYVEFVIFSSGAATATSKGGVGYPISIKEGLNIIRINRADYYKAFYSRDRNNGAYLGKEMSLFNNSYNIANLDGTYYTISFDSAEAVTIHIAGMYALSGNVTLTSLYKFDDNPTFGKEPAKFTLSDDGTGAARATPTSIVSSSEVGLNFNGAEKALKFKHNAGDISSQLVSGKPRYDPYVYIKPLNGKGIDAYDTVQLGFYYDYDLDNPTIEQTKLYNQLFVKSYGKGNVYYRLKQGLNIINIPKSDFAQLCATKSGDSNTINAGAYNYYIQIHYGNMINGATGEDASITPQNLGFSLYFLGAYGLSFGA